MHGSLLETLSYLQLAAVVLSTLNYQRSTMLALLVHHFDLPINHMATILRSRDCPI